MYTKELIDEETIVHLFDILTWLLPLMGIVLGLSFSIFKRNRNFLFIGISIGMLGPLNKALWSVFNIVLDRFGFDTVKSLLLNIVIFVSVGLVLGYLVALISKLLKKKEV
ncbi:hypothetical protein H5T87_00180 [bacterium]|nr:hypothetical protein [bacterium]